MVLSSKCQELCSQRRPTTPENTRMFNDVNSTNRSVFVRPTNCYLWGGDWMPALFIRVLDLTGCNTLLPPTHNEEILSVLKLSVAKLMTLAINYWHKWEQSVNDRHYTHSVNAGGQHNIWCFCCIFESITNGLPLCPAVMSRMRCSSLSRWLCHFFFSLSGVNELQMWIIYALCCNSSVLESQICIANH